MTSIVEYFSSQNGSKCGYCRSTDTSFSHGMWAHSMTPLDYQNLIDRGWRRSGKYCYKPTLQRTCCPLYTIRCEAKSFALSKSQKKVLKKVHRFLSTGDKGKSVEVSSTKSDDDMDTDGASAQVPQAIDMQSITKMKKCKNVKVSNIKCDATEDKSELQTQRVEILPSDTSSLSQSSQHPVSVKPNDLTSPSQCRKAKDIRKEKKLQKLLKKGISLEEAQASLQKRPSEPKSLEDFLKCPSPSEAAHRLELRLLPSSLEKPLFEKTFDESYAVYKKYQLLIHQDPEEKCTTKQFTRFLVNSPMQIPDKSFEKCPYGSYHQQYWLDDKLIAVGVLDILPYCVSSVYFYYDPDYSFLSLGTYASLRELALTRELSTRFRDLRYYYMGYYIHSCVKMRYKGQYSPSYLLCPETYVFQPIEKCKPKLDVSKYHRLEEDPRKTDVDGVVNLRDVMILYDQTRMTYALYKNLKKDSGDEEEVREYAGFVGRKCYTKMLLYRDSEDAS